MTVAFFVSLAVGCGIVELFQTDSGYPYSAFDIRFDQCSDGAATYCLCRPKDAGGECPVEEYDELFIQCLSDDGLFELFQCYASFSNGYLVEDTYGYIVDCYQSVPACGPSKVTP